MARRKQGSLQFTLAIAAAILVLAFLVLMILGDYRFFPALFLSLLIAMLSGIVIYLGFGGEVKLPSPAASSKPAPVAVSASTATAEPKVETKTEASPQPKAEPKAEPKPKAAAKTSAKAAEVAAAPGGESSGPAKLAKPRDGKADDLKKIKGIGPKLEKLCNSMGFYHFDQIANWTPEEIAWVDANLEGFKGRVTRDDWVEQAKVLASGGTTEFAKKVDKGGVY